MTMLWRYISSPVATADLSQFSDNGSVSDWANGAMQWAVSTGLLIGDDGHLNPVSDADVAKLRQSSCVSAKISLNNVLAAAINYAQVHGQQTMYLGAL